MKAPFEKVRSNIEKKRIFERMAASQGKIVLKDAQDRMFDFHCVSLSQEGAVGVLDPKHPQTSAQNLEILGQFQIEEDRYFINGKMAILGDQVVVSMEGEVFKLQRRSNFRIALPPSLPMYANITQIAGKPAALEVRLADMSAGGCRIYFPEGGPNLASGVEIQIVLHPPSGRDFDFKAVIRHTQSVVYKNEIQAQYGIEFLEIPRATHQRLTSLVMDLQHRIIIDSYSDDA